MALARVAAGVAKGKEPWVTKNTPSRSGNSAKSSTSSSSSSSKPTAGGGSAGTRAAPGFIKKGNARYDRHDHFYRRAKEEGFVARSVYKLDEIDREFKLIKKGGTVVDLGCAPGSWMQYVEQRIGESGQAFGIDLLPVRMGFGPNVKIIEGDAFSMTLEQLMNAPEGDIPGVDVVLSDMAPNTTGIRSVDAARSMALSERALEVAQRLLKPGGHFVVKVLEGGEMKTFVDAIRATFTTVKVKRPKSTRPGSTETFVVGVSRRRSKG